MAIYSSKHAKELIAESMRIDPSYESRTAVRVRAILKGERKERTFYIGDLLADHGKQEVQAAIAALQSKSNPFAAVPLA